MPARSPASTLTMIAGTVLLLTSLAARSADSADVARVWSLEDAYWHYVQTGDVEHYVTLWNESFTGWPCSQAHPATKATIGGWVADIRDKKARLTYELVHEAAVQFGEVVIVYYRTPMVYEYPDGRVTGRDRTFKFTHTWLRSGGDWQIIGGMCAPADVVTY